MRRHLVALGMIAAGLCPAVFAQQVDRLLMPISPSVVHGYLGSEWHTTVAISNLSDTAIQVNGFDAGCPFGCPDPILKPHSTVIAQAAAYPCNHSAGSYLQVDAGRLSDVSVTLRTRDMSRANQTWGTLIPIVSAAASFASTFGLSDIPIESQFRSTLRIYGFDPGVSMVRVRVLGVDPTQYSPQNGSPADAVLSDSVVSLAASDDMACPGYAEMSLSSNKFQTNDSIARVEISPISNAGHIWAFASITHNDTQFVTVVSPKQ